MRPTAKNTLDTSDQGGYKLIVQYVTLGGFNAMLMGNFFVGCPRIFIHSYSSFSIESE